MLSLGINQLFLKRGGRLVAVMLVMVFATVTFTGCNNTEPTSSGINSPIVIKYTVNNPLEITEHAEGDDDQFRYVYLTIEGLKDKKIEQAINDKIKVAYDEMRIQDLPPYRGIKTKITEKSEITQEQIYMNVSGNFNNILSIMINKSATYDIPKTEGYSEKDPEYYENIIYFSEVEALNFDLNTGEEIQLKDLFCDDVSYMTVLNDYMSDYVSFNHADEEGYYYMMGADIKLVESFKGFPENQKFAIYPYGITLIFDYNTPQFDTRNMAATPTIYFSDFGDNIAVTERFFKAEQNLFNATEPPGKSLVRKGVKNDVSGDDYIKDGNINIYKNWGYSSTLPEEIKAFLEDMNNVDQAAVDELNQVYQNTSDWEGMGTGEGAYEIMVYGDRIGDYINVSKYTSKYFLAGYEQILEYHCFDSNTLKELKLENLFVKGYDYKSMVLEAIKKTVTENAGNNGDQSTSKYNDVEIEMIYNQISGFNLSSDEMYIPITYSAEGDNMYGQSVYIPYANFGCENMTIFH